jgi:cytochrome c551/c552
LWPLFPKQNTEAGCQTCHAADMVLVSGTWDGTSAKAKTSSGKGCVGCHRYGATRSPNLNSVSQQIKQLETRKRKIQTSG